MSEGIRFADGNVSGAVRVGDTVRRLTGHWTPAVHALLRHLEAKSFGGAPRVLGHDEDGREILSFVAGETMPASLEGFAADDWVVSIAGLLHYYHSSVSDFVPPPDARWRFQPGAPCDGEVICHNDVAPWNTVVSEGRVVALVDWDFAAPAPALWDVAYALWRFTPLYCDDRFGPPIERARRMRLFCDAYGLGSVGRRNLIDVIERRQMALYSTLTEQAANGDAAFAAMLRDGHGDGILRDAQYLRQYRDDLRV